MKYPHVYGDFSCRGFDNRYYQSLKQVLNQGDEEFKKRVRQHILFGSDFTINLFWTDSYHNYIKIFQDTPYLTEEEKHTFASVNPENFLFN